MSFDPNCIFCKIINGDIPSAKIYEDEHVLAFIDISQVTKGHTLIIPKEHQANVYELSEENAAALFRVVPKIANAIKETFQPEGMNLVSNTGEVASQSVFHFHLHLIPRYSKTNDGFKAQWANNMDKYTPEELQQLASQIKANLSAC